MDQLITVGTDGATNWVAGPDGRKYNLGLISVISLVSALVPQKKRVVQLLGEFTDLGSVMFRADSGKLGRILGKVASSSSIEQASVRTMTLLKDLDAIERHIAALREAAQKKATNLPEGVKILAKMASKLSCEGLEAYEPETEEIVDDFLPGVMEVYSYEAYVSNTKTAGTIASKAAEVVDRIDTLVGAGKKFNASKAKVDVRNVTVRVASLLRGDVSKPGVAEELGKLAGEMDRLRSLFFPSK